MKYKGLEKHLHISGQLISDKDTKVIPWKKDSLSTKCCGNNLITTCKKISFDPLLTLYTKMSSSAISDLNMKPKTVQFLK